MGNGDDILEIDVATDTYELDVVDPEVDGEGDRDHGCEISIELDSKLNANRTCFEPGEEFWVRVYSSTTEYDMYTTGGSATLDNSGVVSQVPDPDNIGGEEWEYVNFSNWQGSTRSAIYDVLDKYWCHHDLGEVQWSLGSNLLMVNKPEGSTDLGYGILRIKYQTKYDSWRIVAPTSGHDIKVVVYATGAGNLDEDGNSVCTAELQVAIREDCGMVEEEEDGVVTSAIRDITIKAVNCESEEAIAGVSVFVEDDYKGVTLADGTLYIGKFGSGEYAIRFTHPEYWPSGTDGVVNDTFVVD